MDCIPLIEAMSKFLILYLAEGMDIFKASFSVSGVAKRQMMNKKLIDAFFCRYPKRHANLYKALRSQVTGGLSIVFSRVAIAGETKIRSCQINHPKTCQKNKENKFIQHKYNKGEKRLMDQSLEVDGFVKKPMKFSNSPVVFFIVVRCMP